MKRINPENMPTVRAAVLAFVSEAPHPVSSQELVKKLSDHDPWEIREAVWELCADYLLDFTMDWKIEKPKPLKPKSGSDC